MLHFPFGMGGDDQVPTTENPWSHRALSGTSSHYHANPISRALSRSQRCIPLPTEIWTNAGPRDLPGECKMSFWRDYLD